MGDPVITMAVMRIFEAADPSFNDAKKGESQLRLSGLLAHSLTRVSHCRASKGSLARLTTGAKQCLHLLRC